jgi:hypothetical protein
LLEFDKPGDLHFAWSAPSCPKIEQNHFSAVIGQLHRATTRVSECELRRGLSVFGFP